MDKEIWDRINEATLKEVRDEITNNIFTENEFLSGYREFINPMPQWEYTTRNRMRAMKVPIRRRDEIIKAMRDTGKYDDSIIAPETESISVLRSHSMQQFDAGFIDDGAVAQWDGNVYTTYGGLSRK